MNASLSWYCGAPHTGPLPIAPDDPALLFGATVFTTLRLYGQSLHHPLSRWSAHCDRLRTNLNALGWAHPDWAALETGAFYLSSHYPVLRLTLFPDGREWVAGRSLPPDLAQWQQQGITAWIAGLNQSPLIESSDPVGQTLGRSLPLLKTGNYLAPWHARQQAQQHHATEAILVNPEGHWLETSTGNLWGWGQGCFWTPPLHDGILPGLARSHLISQLRCQNIDIREESWSASVVAQLEAIAYCNSVVEVVPMRRILHSPKSETLYPPQNPGIDLLKQAIATP